MGTPLTVYSKVPASVPGYLRSRRDHHLAHPLPRPCPAPGPHHWTLCTLYTTFLPSRTSSEPFRPPDKQWGEAGRPRSGCVRSLSCVCVCVCMCSQRWAECGGAPGELVRRSGTACLILSCGPKEARDFLCLSPSFARTVRMGGGGARVVCVS